MDEMLEEALDCPSSAYVVDIDDYKTELAECIKSAQVRQKTAYDRGAKTMNYRVGDRVMVHMPHVSTGKTAKLARPYFGSYRVLSLTSTNAEVRLVDKPDNASIFVSLDRVRPCFEELLDRSWSGYSSKQKRKRKNRPSDTDSHTSSDTATVESPPSIEIRPYTGPMTRSRAQANI